jgi:hypothetical protein
METLETDTFIDFISSSDHFETVLVTLSKSRGHLDVPQLFDACMDLIFRDSHYITLLKDMEEHNVELETRQEIMSAITKRMY